MIWDGSAIPNTGVPGNVGGYSIERLIKASADGAVSYTHLNTMVVHNPESNMGNACGCPPTMELVHRGILTGLGTDGYTHDMMESFKVANILHKHHLCDPNAAWGEVPKMLFENNAKIAGRYFDQKLGVLEEGAAADVIIVNYNPLTPMNENNINGHLVFGVTGHDVVTTVANGKVLMKDRRLTEIDEAKVKMCIRDSTYRKWCVWLFLILMC